MFPNMFNPDRGAFAGTKELWDLFRAKFDCMRYNGKVPFKRRAILGILGITGKWPIEIVDLSIKNSDFP